MDVTNLNASEYSAWDRFVLEHPHGSSFHLTAWKTSIEATFGFQPFYFAARSGGALQGVLPLFLVDNWVMGRTLISSPFAVYGGILAASDQAREALLNAARKLADSLDVQHLELRNGYPEQTSGLPVISRYATFHQPTVADGEHLLAAIPKKTRNLVRKALKHPFSSRPAASLDTFFDLYTRNLRRLGTPSFPRRHFTNLQQAFGEMVDVKEILLGEKVVAASFNFYFREQMHTYYAASDQNALSYSPNNFMYYDHILWAAGHGYSLFDFGRSRLHTGPYEFKRHWNTTLRDLPYEVHLVRRKELPNFSPANPKMHLVIRAWSLLPLGVTRLLGPRLVRLFP